MKKTIYLFSLLMLAGAMVFTSCNKDDDDDPAVVTPVLTFMGGDYISTDVTLIIGEAFKVGVTAAENPTSKKNLESFKVVRTFNNVNTTVFEETSIGEATYTWNDTLNANAAAGTERWTFTITDKDGQMKELSFTITTESGTTPLGAEEALVWQRVGGADGTGLDMFGLKWTSNGKAVMAQIEKDMADKFVELTPAEWTSLETVEDLAAAVEAGTDMTMFDQISAELATSTFDYALATKYNGEYFLIHLTDATVVVETAGTTITINGMYKK